MSILEIHQKIEHLTKQGFKLDSDGKILINELPKETKYRYQQDKL